MNAYLQVAAGGAIGAMLRHAAGRALPWPAFPLATLLVNMTGSFAMGLLAALLAGRGGHLAPFLMTGVLGGFTTFSAFSLDALSLWQQGQQALAGAYVAASVALALLGVAAGFAVGRGVVA